MRYLAMLLVLWIAAAAPAQPATPPPEDDGMGGDLGGTAGTGVVDWVPVIRSFYIQPEGAEEVVKVTLKPFDAQGLPSEMLQWEKLKALIERKRDANGALQPYGPDQPIVVSWRYKVNPDGTTGYELDSRDKDKPIQVLLSSSRFHITLEVDVLMTTDPKTKEDLLHKHFNFTVCEVSIWPVGPVDDPASKAFWKAMTEPGLKAPKALEGYRLPVLATMPIANYGIPEAKRVILPPFLAENSNDVATQGRYEANVRGAGVYEFRIKLGVSGRVDETEEPIIKTVEGTIRAAFIDAKIDVRILNYDTEKSSIQSLPTKTKTGQ